MKARICDVKRFAVHDGDGIRTTVFFKGCPLRCAWCHNPEGLASAPQIARYTHKCIGCGECKKEGFTPEDCLGEARILYGKAVTVDELLPMLLEDKDFYEASGGGVTLSGGEPFCQPAPLAELAAALKEKGFHLMCYSGFTFEELLAVTVLGRNKLNIYFDDRVLQFKGDKRFNAVKYVHLFHRYKNLKRGDDNVQFLGL